MSALQIEKVHPGWPEHADLHCPLCGLGLEDKEQMWDGEYHYFCLDEGIVRQKMDCPHCHQPIVVQRTVDIRITYKASKP